MEKSDSIIELAIALNGFHKSVGKIKKGSENPFFKSKYADLSDILDKISEPLTENGLSIIQLPKDVNELETILIHTSGQFISSTYKMTPVKTDPQSLGSAITYQRRYALSAILSLNIDADDDGNGASGKTTESEKTLKEKYNSELQSAINIVNVQTTDEKVIEVWNKYQELQSDETFRKAILTKRKELTVVKY